MKDITKIAPLDYLSIPWKWRWYFIAAVALALVGTAIYAWRSPNIYRSETRIVVNSSTVLDDAALSGPANRAEQAEERIDAIRQLLESRSILQRIVEEFRIRTIDLSTPMEDAIKSIRSNLEFSKATGGTFTMAYYAEDPQTAQAIARRLAEILIQTNQTAQRNRVVDKDQFFEQELKQAESELAAIEEKIKQFKANHIGELPELSASNMNALNGLRNQLVLITSAMDRDHDQQKNLEFRIQELRRMSSLTKSLSSKTDLNIQSAASSNLNALLSVKRAQLSEAAARFTPKHPDVVRLTKEVADLEKQIANDDDTLAKPITNAASSQATTETIASENSRTPSQAELNTESEIIQARHELDNLSKNIARREKERDEITKDITQYQNRLNLAPALDQELGTLMREHDTNQQRVTSLENRKFNTQMTANAMADRKNDVYRILDEANLPEKPIFPTRRDIILIGIGASLVAGFAASLARELLESSIATEEEVISLLNLPVIANIPEIPKPLKP
jgi:polysaccharide biosynthesis transport protein